MKKQKEISRVTVVMNKRVYEAFKEYCNKYSYNYSGKFNSIIANFIFKETVDKKAVDMLIKK